MNPNQTIKEPIVLKTGKKVKGIVREQDFDGWYWRGEYIDFYGYSHFVTLRGQTWCE